MPANSFVHGVASFDPTETAVLLWTRTSAPATVTWRVFLDADCTVEVDAGSETTTADADCTLTVDVTGLEPATTYFYRFDHDDPERADGGRSTVGRTRTLPVTPVDRVRLGVTCCADYSAAPLGVYRALAEREVDLVVHLGDYIYEAETSNSGRRAEFAETATDVDGYRGRYAQIRTDPDAQHLHARHPMVCIWDDHDFADNAWRTGAKAHDPDVHGSWDARVDAAVRARQEWLPIRHRDPDQPRSTWRSIAIGDLVDLVLLDTRYEGRDRQAGDDGTLPHDHPDRSLLGDPQRAFVGERLADTGRPWAVVASGVVVNEISLPLPGGTRLPNSMLPNGYAVLDDAVVHDDQWDGYTAERDLLVRRMEQRVAAGGQTVLLSGDVHSCWAFEGPAGSGGQPVAVEAVCPAASSAAMGRSNLPGVNRLLDHAVRRMSQVQWADVTERGYTICDIDRARVQLEWWIVDPYSLDPGGDSECAAVRALRLERRPCRFDVIEEPSDDPLRPHVPTTPPRPDDLPSLRRTRVLRLTSKSIAALVAVGAPALALWRLRSGRR